MEDFLVRQDKEFKFLIGRLKRVKGYEKYKNVIQFKFLIGRLKPQKNLSTGAGKMKFSKKFCVKPPALQIHTK